MTVKLLKNSAFAIIVTLIASCANSAERATAKNSEPTQTEKEDSMKLYYDSIASGWRSDPCGCKGFRKAVDLDDLIRYYNLEGKDTTEFFKVLGRPNDFTRSINDDGEVGFFARYYYETNCPDGPESTDAYPWAEKHIVFDSLGILQPHSHAYFDFISD